MRACVRACVCVCAVDVVDVHAAVCICVSNSCLSQLVFCPSLFLVRMYLCTQKGFVNYKVRPKLKIYLIGLLQNCCFCLF